ncbi:hypothetical protein ACVI1N_000873 [Sinorhizobium medicae]
MGQRELEFSGVRGTQFHCRLLANVRFFHKAEAPSD